MIYLAILLYLLGCFMHYILIKEVNGRDFVVDIILSFLWPIQTIAFLLISIYNSTIKRIVR